MNEPSDGGKITFVHQGAGIRMSFIVSFDEFTDAYNANIEIPDSPGQPHPPNMMWKSGSVQDNEIKLELASDLGDGSVGPQTTEELVTVCQNFMRMGMPPPQAGGFIFKNTDLLYVQIGVWFRRAYVVLDVGVVFKGPYEVSTGRPMRASITLKVKPYYGIDPIKSVNRDVFSFTG